MICLPAPALSPGEAACALAARGGAVWSRTALRDHVEDVIHHVAAEPVRVVEGENVEALTHAWQQARAAWACGEANVPVAFGFLSYDLGKSFVGGRFSAQVASGWPGLEFRFYDAVLEVGPRGQPRILAQDAPAARRLAASLTAGTLAPPTQELLGPLAAAEAPGLFKAQVERVRGYLRAGDTYQVNLARRLEAPVNRLGLFAGLPLALALSQATPAPFGFWLGPQRQGPARALVGNSPERFLHMAPDRVLTTAPIKGTRPRSRESASQQASLEPEAVALRTSLKDRAEHDMIVDLERNDLGRVCEVGSVRVREHARLLHLPTVHHLVSRVEGRLRAELNLADVLAATFPGGSITGAPKRRAMEIISELETHARGPYTGATGWLGAAGDFDLAIAIRTAALREDRLTLWVGGGIVIDSEPEAEFAETEAKAQAFARLW